jgi:hypothetical protein
MPISPLTNQVIAPSEIPEFDANICVDWATEMIGLGYNSENILMLAGFSKPVNYFETIAYLNKALAELNLQLKTGEDGTVTYCSYIILNIANSIDVKTNLNRISKLYSEFAYPDTIYDFNLLWWAWADLDYDKNAYPTYWADATADNIELLVIDAAKGWLEKNTTIYSL